MLRLILKILLSLLVVKNIHAEVVSGLSDELLREADRFGDVNNLDFLSPNVMNQGDGVYSWEKPSRKIMHPKFGMVTRPSSKVRSIKRTKDKIIYDVVYTTDQYSRRINLIPIQKSHKKFLFLGGCSFTHGIGLNDSETLNHYINASHTDYYAFNYAIGGGAINNLLARMIDEENFKDQLPFSSGDFAFIYIDSHVTRVVGAWPSVWSFSAPYFKKTETGVLEFAGTIEENMSWIRKKIVKNADLLPTFLKKNRYIPRITSTDYKYFCDLVVGAREVWKRKISSGRFVFIFHPMTHVDEKIVTCLEKNNIEHFAPRVDDYHSKYAISMDGHPNGELNKVLSTKILEYLAK